MSLIEVMLASALGLLLTFGLVQIYLSMQKAFNLQQTIVGMQENGRFAVHFLQTNIRMAGYAACDSNDVFVRPDTAIMGYHNQIPASLKNKNIKKNTDIIQIGKCATRNKKNIFEQTVFFIGAADRKNKIGKTIYALYESPLSDVKNELVSGIENMRISYGISTMAENKNVEQYVDADAVRDWKKIRAIKIALLLTSELPVLTRPESYEFSGTRFPADRFSHREWDTYVTLRNLQ
jgi:type IV pilus assembly protein PilW